MKLYQNLMLPLLLSPIFVFAQTKYGLKLQQKSTSELGEMLKKDSSDSTVIRELCRRGREVIPFLPTIYKEYERKDAYPNSHVHLAIGLSNAAYSVPEILDYAESLLLSKNDDLIDKGLTLLELSTPRSAGKAPSALKLLNHSLSRIRIRAGLLALKLDPLNAPVVFTSLLEIYKSAPKKEKMDAASALMHIYPAYFQVEILKILSDPKNPYFADAITILYDAPLPNYLLSDHLRIKLIESLNIDDQSISEHRCLAMEKFENPQTYFYLLGSYRGSLEPPKITAIGRNNAKECIILLLNRDMISCGILKAQTIDNLSMQKYAGHDLNKALWTEIQSRTHVCKDAK